MNRRHKAELLLTVLSAVFIAALGIVGIIVFF